MQAKMQAIYTNTAALPACHLSCMSNKLIFPYIRTQPLGHSPFIALLYWGIHVAVLANAWIE
jgi:hypothetical protein